MFQSRLVLGFGFFLISSSWMALAHPAPMAVEKLRQNLLSMSDHELFEAASAKRKLSDGNNWSRVGACLQNDASQCVSCACTSYTQTNYANPTGYNGLPYSPTVPGTGCASLKFNPPDVITCWPGWAELGLCPAQNRGLEKLVANQMRVALKNTSVDVCKLKEYILLAGLEEEDSKENDRNDDKMIAHPPLAGGPAVEDPSQSSSSQRPQLPDQVPAAPASEIKPLPAKKPVIVSHPGVPVQPVVLPFRSSPKPVRSGVVSIRDLKPQGFSKSSKCGLVFVSPTGAEALIPMEAQRCEALSRVLKSKGVIGSKEAEILIKEASFSEKALMAADQKCNAGLGRYRDYMLHLAAAIAKSNPDAGTVSNVLALLEDAVDRTKDSIRACVDRSFKAPRK